MSNTTTPDAPLGWDTPYDGLTPEAVLDALDGVGLRGDGRLIQLNSYENRVFQVFLEDGRVVVPKFYRPGRWSDAQILEEHAFAQELAEQEVPVVAPWTLQSDPGAAASTLASIRVGSQTYRFSVCERRSGRAPELEEAAVLEWIGRFIGRLHAVGSRRVFENRLQLSVSRHGEEARDWLLNSELIPPEAQSRWRDAVELALAEVRRCFEAVGPCRSIRLHGDCHVGNVLWTDTGPHFVDLDDAMNGPAVQDLWMLLPGDAEAMQARMQALLRGYEQFMDFDRRELRLIEALRTLRMIHYSAWVARRWNDPAFPAAFPWFGDRSYWMEQATRLLQQREALIESAQRDDRF